MKTFLVILFINLILFTLLFLYCSCKVASKADEEIEKEFNKKYGGKL